MIPPLRDPLARRTAFVLGTLWTLLVLVLSLMPSPPTPPGVLAWDKAQHAAAYAFLTWWWLQALSGRHQVRVMLALGAFGVAIELLQGWSPARSLQLTDMVANATGIGIGAGLCATRLGGVLAWLAGHYRKTGRAKKRPAEPGV
jgi:VanZ family protein